MATAAKTSVPKLDVQSVPVTPVGKSLVHHDQSSSRKTMPEDLVGLKIEVLWKDGEQGDTWEKATIVEYKEYDKAHLLRYADGDQDWFNLNDIEYRVVGRGDLSASEGLDSGISTLHKTFAAQGLFGTTLLGRHIEVFWEDQDDETKGQWWAATIVEYRAADRCHCLQFEDGEKEWYELEQIKYRILGTEHHKGQIAFLTHHGKELDYADFGLEKEDLVGRRVEVFWHDDETPGAGPNDGEWFSGKIRKYDSEKDEHFVQYTDGDTHWYKLLDVRYRALDVDGLTLISSRSEDRQTKQNGIEPHHPHLGPKASFKGNIGAVAEMKDPLAENKEAISSPNSKTKISPIVTNPKSLTPTPVISPTKGQKIAPGKGLTGDHADEMEEEFLPGHPIPIPMLPQRNTINEFLDGIRQGDAVTEHERSAAWYLDEFDHDAPDKEIIIGSISLADVEMQERKMQEDRLVSLQKEAARQRRRTENLTRMEAAAKERVLAEHDRLHHVLERKRLLMQRKAKLIEQKLRRSFQRKKELLRENLEKQKGIVTERLGHLQERPDHLGLTMSMFGVNWKHVPQPVEMKIHLARAVRDRLPNGRYVMLLTLYDRFGGNPLYWTELGLSGAGVGLPGATEPVRHNGRYYDTEMIFDESVYTVAPSDQDLRPTLTYVLELYQLGTARWPDKVVAWAAFPAVDVDVNLYSGRMKVPFLRGPIDKTIDKYRSIEQTYCKDIDRWLFNLYLDVYMLPKEVVLGDGTSLRDREIEVDYTRHLLALRDPSPVDSNLDESNETMFVKDPNADGIQSEADVGDQVSSEGLRKRSAFQRKQNVEKERTAKSHMNPGKMKRVNTHQGHDLELKRQGFKVNTALLEKYESSMRKRGDKDAGSSILGEAGRRFSFLMQEFKSEYNVRRMGTIDFWVSIFILLCAFYVRMFAHYIGQYIFLKILGVNVYRFTPRFHTVITKYPHASLPAYVELGAAMAGQTFNIITFMWFMTLAIICTKILGKFPIICSKFMIGYGLGTVFDGIVTLSVDLAVTNYNCGSIPVCADISDSSCDCMTGDFFKLGERFYETEGTSIPGFLVTAVAFTVLFVFAGVVYYNYLLALHFNGRVWDLYWRLSSYEESFFVPEDMEISVGELRWICSKAARWRGPKGEKRKCAVVEYVLTDPLAPTFKEVTTHLAIYHVDPSDERTLYRHFLRLPDGTLLEIFGDLMQAVKVQYSTLEHVLIEAGGSQVTSVDEFLGSMTS